MKRYIILVALFITFQMLQAQTAFSELAKSFAAEGNYEKAINYEEKSLEMIESVYGKNNYKYSLSLSKIADYYAEIERYQDAIRAEKENLNIIESILGTNNNYYATILNNLSLDVYRLGNYNEALELGYKAYKIRKLILNESDPDYLSSLNNLAIYYSNIGDYYNAIKLTEECVSIRKQEFGEKHIDYINSLNNLALFNSYLGNYHYALKLGEDVCHHYKEILGERHKDYIMSIANLSLYNSFLGKYAEALDLGLETCNLYRTISGETSVDYATALMNLASYYSDLGNIEEAIRLTEIASNIRKEILGNSNTLYAMTLSNLSNYYAKIGNYELALKLATESLEIRMSCLGIHNLDYIKSLDNLAACYYYIYNYNEAIETGELALKIVQEYFGEEHPIYVELLKNLAIYNFYAGNLQTAENLGNESLKSIEKYMDVNNPNYTRCIFDLLLIYQLTPKYILKLSKIICNNYNKEVQHNFRYLSSFYRETYWNTRKNWFDYLLPCTIYFYLDDDLVSQAYNMLLLSKGILLNSEIEFDKFLAETGDEVLLEKYNEIKMMRLQLNKLYEKPIAERYIDTDSLERQANELERQLMQESAEFGDYTRNLSITWEDVRDNLKEREAAIEFVHFPLNNDSTMYMAYVLRPDMEAPELVKLFEEKDLTNLIDEDDKASIYFNKSASELIWGKSRPQLEGVENVYFAPDGVLHQIAIEYLPDIDGEGMISDKFNLHRLSSTREIALNRHNAPTKEAVVYGGIKYDTDVATMETESRKYERPKNRGFSTYYNLGDSLALRGSLEYLDGSLTEAENINGMMKENNYNSTFLSGNDATEESFKSLSGKSNGIIHISTHGFYWTESEAERKASLNDRLMFMSQLGDNARRNVEDKALTRTGLFMAGAKNALGGVDLPEGVDDGILTAQEIANLDLRGLDLVVLSACQTGMGDISGDGVFGLQRGFKKAGANSILMSLWDVSDEATQILMTNFYKNYLGGMSKQQALREAQRAVRETPGFSDPEYWAAFILLDALN